MSLHCLWPAPLRVGCLRSNALCFPGTEVFTHGPTAGGRAGPEATAALPILAALLPAAADQGHPGALQACYQAGRSRECWDWGASSRGQREGLEPRVRRQYRRATGSPCWESSLAPVCPGYIMQLPAPCQGLNKADSSADKHNRAWTQLHVTGIPASDAQPDVIVRNHQGV